MVNFDIIFVNIITTESISVLKRFYVFVIFFIIMQYIEYYSSLYLIILSNLKLFKFFIDYNQTFYLLMSIDF